MNFNDIFEIAPFAIQDNPIFQKPAINIMTDALMNHPIMPQAVIMSSVNNNNIFNEQVRPAAGGFRSKKRKRTNTHSNRRYRKNRKTKKINKRKNRNRFRKKY